MQKNGTGLDLHERLSHLSHISDGGDFKEVKSPNELEGGALRPGGPLNLFSREAIGLLGQYAAVGLIYGLFPSLRIPLINNYFHLDGYQVASYNVLVAMGWSFKVFMGIISDCFPILGYKRKPYMLLGWGVCCVCLVTITASSFPAPYYGKKELFSKLYKDISIADRKFINVDAPNSGFKFIMLSMLASFGYVLADVAADAMVVQYAQREPEEIRGRIQTAIYFTRYIFSAMSSLIVGFLMNGPQYGGEFGWAISPNAIYGILIVPCAFAIFCTIFLVKEEKTERRYFGAYIREFWELLKLRVMWQVCAFRFISNIFYNFDATPESNIASYWAGVKPLSDNIFNVLGKLSFAAILFICGKWGLNWNWRYAIICGTMFVVALDSFVMFFTIWDVVRSQWFYLGVSLTENIPSGLRFIIATYCSVEISDLGNEGAVYGLVTTVNNLASPFASVLYKTVDSYFDVNKDDILRDDRYARTQVTYVFLLSYSMKVLSLVWLFMLPPQKRQMQELKKKGGSSQMAAIILTVVFFVALIYSLTTQIMSIYPATACLRIAGGKGICKK